MLFKIVREGLHFAFNPLFDLVLLPQRDTRRVGGAMHAHALHSSSPECHVTTGPRRFRWSDAGFFLQPLFQGERLCRLRVCIAHCLVVAATKKLL